MPDTLSKTLNVRQWAFSRSGVYAGDCHNAFSIAWNSKQSYEAVCETFLFNQTVGELIGIHAEIAISKVGHMSFYELIQNSIDSGKEHADAGDIDVLFLSGTQRTKTVFVLATVLNKQAAEILIARSKIIEAAYKKTSPLN